MSITLRVPNCRCDCASCDGTTAVRRRLRNPVTFALTNQFLERYDLGRVRSED